MRYVSALRISAEGRGAQEGEFGVFIKSRALGAARRTAANVDGGGSGESPATVLLRMISKTLSVAICGDRRKAVERVVRLHPAK
jgi:hypothetical protein